MRVLSQAFGLLLGMVLGIYLFNLLIAAPSVPSPAPTVVIVSDQIVGDPDLSASFINQVLSAADSPAQGLGSVFYQESIAYHIKDSYALSTFHWEDGYGKRGIAQRTGGMGNIRCTPGWKRCVDGYRAYDSWAAGIEDFYRLIHDTYIMHGRTTLESIIPAYAPASDGNDPSSYIQHIEADMVRWQQGRV